MNHDKTPIPPEVVEAAHKLLWYDGGGYDVLPEHIRAAIAAGLAAWPGGWRDDMEDACGVRRRLILPFTEASNG